MASNETRINLWSTHHDTRAGGLSADDISYSI